MLGAVLFCVWLADVMYITVDGLIGNEQGIFWCSGVGECFGCVVSNFLCFENICHEYFPCLPSTHNEYP